jgi:hypothetical protein
MRKTCCVSVLLSQYAMLSVLSFQLTKVSMDQQKGHGTDSAVHATNSRRLTNSQSPSFPSTRGRRWLADGSVRIRRAVDA